jgi:hypothetical protein
MNLISKIRTIFKNRKAIWQGFYFRYFGREDWIEQVAKTRMHICNQCPHIDNIGHQCMVPATQPCCGKCGCSLKIKTFSLSSGCGDEENPRWNAVLTEEQEDVFREAMKKRHK